MTSKQRKIGGISCLVTEVAEPRARLLMAHGAGSPMDSLFMEQMAGLLCERSVEIIRFEFPYMAQRRLGGGKPPPDRQPVLLASWRQLIAALTKTSGPPLCIGGKSMGGRMATLVVADSAQPVPINAVVCLGYPFHPQGKPQVLRTAHLMAMTTPTLIVQGTRDPMGKPEEVRGYRLPETIQLAWLDTADHDFKPLVKSGLSQADCLARAADHIAAFLIGLH